MYCKIQIHFVIYGTKYVKSEYWVCYKLIFFNLSNKSCKTFMQKGTDQKPFDFFQFWYPKLMCLFISLLCCFN